MSRIVEPKTVLHEAAKAALREAEPYLGATRSVSARRLTPGPHRRGRLERDRVTDRRPLKRNDTVAAGNGRAQVGDRLVRARGGHLDLAGDHVAGTDRGRELPCDLEEDRARAGKILGDNRVQDGARDPALDDDLAEARGAGCGLVVVERIAVARD